MCSPFSSKVYLHSFLGAGRGGTSPSFAGLGKHSFGEEALAAAWKAAAWRAALDETQGLSRGVATGTFEKELELAPKTGFILSACTEVQSKVGHSKASRLKELATLRPAEFASETWLRCTILLKVCPDTSLLESHGSVNSAASCKTFAVSYNSRICCGSRFTRDSQQWRLSVTLQSTFLSASVRESCSADILELFGTRQPFYVGFCCIRGIVFTDDDCLDDKPSSCEW